MLQARGQSWNEATCKAALDMMLERVTFLEEVAQTDWLFGPPSAFQEKMIRKKWKDQTAGHLEDLALELEALQEFTSDQVETTFKAFLEARELGFGQVLLPFRLALTGEGGGPSMFEFAAFLGKETTLQRLREGTAHIEALRAQTSDGTTS